MASSPKQKIIETLDILPGDSLTTVAEFVDFLRAKAIGRPSAPVAQPAKDAKLGGLWSGVAFSETEIAEARAEAWSGLGRGAE